VSNFLGSDQSRWIIIPNLFDSLLQEQLYQKLKKEIIHKNHINIQNGHDKIVDKTTKNVVYCYQKRKEKKGKNKGMISLNFEL